MGVVFKFEGLEELKAALRKLPEELAGEAGNLAEAAGNGAVVDIRAIYSRHRRSGDLMSGVHISHFDKGRFSAGVIVKSMAPHAWLFDHGSQARHYYTKNGKRHATGAMWSRTPPTFAFIKTMIRARVKLYTDLRALLVRKGLSVTGDGR